VGSLVGPFVGSFRFVPFEKTPALSLLRLVLRLRSFGGSFVGPLVGPLVGPTVGPVVGPLVQEVCEIANCGISNCGILVGPLIGPFVGPLRFVPFGFQIAGFGN